MSAGTVENQLFWREFLELYKSLPVLWKIKSSDYCNRNLKSSAYDEMVGKLREINPNANRGMVVRKINTFRSNYKRELKRVKQSKESGAAADDVFVPSLWYFDILSFLEDQDDYTDGRLTIDVSATTSFSDVVESKPLTEKKIKLFKEEDKQNKVACEHRKESSNDAYIMARAWASQYAELDSQQKVLARKIISEVLFQGCLRNLNTNTVRDVQKVLEYSDRTSTPIFTDSSDISSPVTTLSSNVHRSMS